MKQFKNILLVYGPNQQTLELAVRLAKNNYARLNIIDVIKQIPPQRSHLASQISSLNLKEFLVKEHQKWLKKLIGPIYEESIRVSTTVVFGTPFLEIIREVLRKKHDLVIMTAEGRGGLKERLFGSTSMHLMRKCPCPVWVVRPNLQKQYARILAAVDPEPLNKKRNSLNTLIMDLANSTADFEKAELHIVHAWTLFSETFLTVRGHLPYDELNKLIMQEEVMHKKQIETFIKKYKKGGFRLHILKGEADEVIPRIARAEKVDLLVMGTVCRTGIPGFFIGNTAEKVLNKVSCSVLTVKPEGFVSPVTLEV